MIKTALRINATLLVLAPWLYIALRLTGIVNNDQDLLIILGLFVVSVITAFLTFGKDE